MYSLYMEVPTNKILSISTFHAKCTKYFLLPYTVSEHVTVAVLWLDNVLYDHGETDTVFNGKVMAVGVVDCLSDNGRALLTV